jgi:hypothetical protein
MGLTISYEFKLKADADTAREAIERLYRFAKTPPFQRLTEIMEYDPPDGRYVFAKPSAEQLRSKPGHRYLIRKRADGLKETVRVPPIHAMRFVAFSNGGETAAFGLASHPPMVIHREDVITHPPGCAEARQMGVGQPIEYATRLCGWYSWSSGCKTQYAAHPRHGGVENFVRVHTSIIAVLEECRRLGMSVKVADDGKYWKHRNVDRLVAQLGKWDGLVASVVGKLSDTLGSSGGTLIAPIKERSDFEHLEAKGETEIRKANQRPRKAAARRKRPPENAP